MSSGPLTEEQEQDSHAGKRSEEMDVWRLAGCSADGHQWRSGSVIQLVG